MKRKGDVWKELIDIENCNAAVLSALKNKKKTPYIKHILENHTEYGQKIQQIMINGWSPGPIREKTINESINNKTRDLKIPNLTDHMIHTAVAKIPD